MNYLQTIFHPLLLETVWLCSTTLLLMIGIFFRNKKIVLLGTYSIFIISILILLLKTDVAFTSNFISFSFISDQVGDILKLLVIIFCTFHVTYNHYSHEYNNKLFLEYHILTLFSSLGILLLISASNLIAIFLGLELMSLSLYSLVALQKNNKNSIESSIKFFVFGGVSSGIMLFGISLWIIAVGDIGLNSENIIILQGYKYSWIIYGLLFVGIGFKLSLVPFHMWAPDVYEGSQTPTTFFIATVSKIGGFAILLRLTEPMGMASVDILLFFSIISIVLGNIAAINQVNIKRLMAYSGIAHMGYLVLGFVSGIIETSGYFVSIFYLISYITATSCVFGFLLVVKRDNYEEIITLNDLIGLNKQAPVLSFCMLIAMFSLAGIPPLMGFIAKFIVIQSILYIYPVLSTVALIATVLGAYYYIKIIKFMYFDTSNLDYKFHISRPGSVVLLLNSLLLIIFGIFPSAVLQYALI